MDSPLIISEKPKPALHNGHLTVGCLIFPRTDQIDFTGPFEVLSRIPDSSVYVMAEDHYSHPGCAGAYPHPGDFDCRGATVGRLAGSWWIWSAGVDGG